MKRGATLFLTAVLLLTATLAAATTVVKLDFAGLVRASDVIVVGRVTSVDALERDGRVYSHIDIAVEETLKGQPRSRVQLVQLGGRTERLATVVHGMPDFTVDERALLFLEEPTGYDYFVVTGLAQGKFTLASADDGSIRLVQSTANLHTLAPRQLERVQPGTTLPTKPLAPAALPTTLDEARTRIVDLLKSDATE